MKRLAWALVAPAIFLACSKSDDVDLGALTDADAGVDASIPPDEADPDPTPDAGTDASKPAVCGDGKLAKSEQCDDGNNADNDGCSSTCTPEVSGPNDVCPGVSVTLSGTGDQDRTAQITGDTSSVYNQYTGSCGGASGTEAVYVVTSDMSGFMRVNLTSTFDSVLYARRACDDTKTEVACNDATGNAGGDSILVSVTKGEPMYLFVDGYAGSTGTFTLDIDVQKPSCGNGSVEPPETCDDGNTDPGDGCAADCTFEPGGVISDCPGQDIRFKGTGDAPRHVAIANTTLGLTSSTLSASQCSSGGYNHVYAFTPDVNGTINVTLVASYVNATLHTRSECDNAFMQLDCTTTAAAYQPIKLSLPVTAGYPTYFIVDSTLSAYAGPYTLDATLTPAACGNGIVDGGEECDDGNAATGDGCTATCKLEPYADTTCPGNALTLAPVTDPVIGQYYTRRLTSSTAGLTTKFKSKVSTNGCLTANTSYSDAVYNFVSPVTGRLHVNLAGAFDSTIEVRTGGCNDSDTGVAETCMNSVKGRGAESLDMQVNAGTTYYVIADCQSQAAATSGVFTLELEAYPKVCGNGFIDPAETCDDGNTVAGDGCNAQCILEPATNDTCLNAGNLNLASDGTVTTISSGTTNLANNQAFLECAGTDGRDAIYTFTPDIDGVVTADIVAATFNVALGARTSCPVSTAATSPLVCSNKSSGKGGESIVFAVSKGQTYWLIVDGAGASDYGTYTMNVKLNPPQCGDTLVSGSEQCDDGNKTAGDGCSPTCTVEPMTDIDTCPGHTLTLSAGGGSEPRTGTLTIDTTALAANYGGNCGGNSTDGVVVVTPDVSGTLTARLTGLNYHSVLYVRTTCNDAATELTCDSDNTASAGTRDISISGVTAGTPYYLFIDGFAYTSGVGLLQVTVTP